jgi:hypothetical protein
MRVAGILTTVILDPPTALLFGCVVALVSAQLIARNPESEVLRTGVLGAGWSVFYGLCVGWFFFQRPDWMFAYLKDARDVSLLPTYLVFLVVLAAHGAAGGVATAALLRNGRRGAAWALTVAALITLGATFWLQWKQYTLLGSFEEYWSGRARTIHADASMRLAMNVSGALSAVSAASVLVARLLKVRRLMSGGRASETHPA